MFRSSATGRRRRAATLVGLLAVTLLSGLLSVGPDPISHASADTAPPADPTLPTTVSAAVLPTVQINGVVWAQVIVGNTVYATGEFTSARPAGSALGVNETPRSNILAYNLTTGALITTWAPTLDAQGLAIAASADGSTIYVGGDFDQVSGQWRSRVAALDATTGALKAFNPGANTTVRAFALNSATNTLYYGGFFTQVGNSAAGFTNRSRLAAVNATTGALLPWSPSSDLEVISMVVHPASGRVIVGGSFNTLNGSQQWGMGSLDGVTGAVEPWAANTVIQNHNDSSAISALTTDGDKIYGTGWAYFGGGATANFEGVFAADPMTGVLDWIDGGRGDNYGIAITGKVLYTVGHPHDWGMLGWNPQYDPYKWQRTMAISTQRSATLTNAYGTPDIWQPFMGRPAAQPLHWLPSITGGTYTGQSQGAWSVATNGDYVVEGGEFPKVNNVNQQGLVRFAKREISPVTDDVQNYSETTPTLTAQGPGTVRVGWLASWDRDNANLKVEVLRGATAAASTVLKTFTTSTTWWNRPPLGFVDTTAPAGSSQTYRIRVTDPYGAGFTGPPATITIPDGAPPSSTYSSAVQSDNPTWQWRLDEASGTVAADRANANDLTLNGTGALNQSGALLNEADSSVSFPGTTSTATVPATSTYWEPGPQTFSLEAWVNTTTTAGGQIMGFGGSNNARSADGAIDRTIYMTTTGQIRFGVRPDMGTRQTVNSPGTYRDGAWHHVVGTLDGSGLKLYVDGNLVASNAAVVKAQVYRGYWRIGGDRLTNWPGAPVKEAITAKIDEAAVYPYALSLGRIRSHFIASGQTPSFPNINPVAGFTATNRYLTANLTSTSTDDDGSIANTSWTFGDGTYGSGLAASHTYASAGTYNVTVTVTDDRGGVSSTTNPVTVTDPPPNVLPTAGFGFSTLFHSATFTSSSTDSDGTIVSSAWDFGDGTFGTAVSPQHDYSVAGTYNVSLTVTDDRGGTNTVTKPVTITDLYTTDTFNRTVSNGFGSADLGGPWTLSGTAASFSVSGGVGRIAGALGTSPAAFLGTQRKTDIDIKADVALSSAATGGGAYVSIIGRRVSNNNDYRLKLRYLAGGTMIAYLTHTLAGAETIIATANVPLTLSPGDVLRTRFQVVGSNPTLVKAKVWRASAAEPSAWLITGSETTPAALQAAGDVGVMLYTSSTWTGTAPTLTVDNFQSGPDTPPVNTPPVASFSSSAQTLTATFNAAGSTDPGGSIVSYAWSFGDGTFGSGVAPTHTYAANNTYNVGLTVTDNGGASTTVTQPVTVSNLAPVASFTSNVQDLGATVTSTSSDPDGVIADTVWNFGEPGSATNSAAGPTASHTYALAGTYTVTVTVTDNDGLSTSTTNPVTVTDPPPNIPPTASFTSTSTNLTATVTSTSNDPDGSIVGTTWDFGDPGSGGANLATGTPKSHTYPASGTYPVTLTVTDDDGAVTSKTIPVTVTNLLPAASFTSAATYLNAAFTSTSTDPDGTIASTSWTFGDPTSGANTGAGATAGHTYTAAGTYTVTVTVTDDDGGVSSSSAPITVVAPPTDYATDLFGRTVANGFGTADLGGAWTVAGTASGFSVSGGAARMLGQLGGGPAAYLGAVRQTNVEINADVALDKAATGGGAYISVIGRRVSNNNDYRVKLRYQVGGTVTLYLVRTLAGVETTLGTVPLSGTFAAGDVLHVRFQVTGSPATTVRAKVWRAAATEPAAWTVTGAETAPAALQAAGDSGFMLYTSGSWTGTVGTLTIDNLHVGPLQAG